MPDSLATRSWVPTDRYADALQRPSAPRVDDDPAAAARGAQIIRASEAVARLFARFPCTAP